MALEDDIRILSATPLLDELGHDALRLLAFSADRLTFADGDVLFREGQHADAGYVVLAGEVALMREAGGERSAYAGALLGELALLTDTTRPATATARGDVRIYRIARSVFARLFDEYPELAAKLHARLVARMQANARDLRDVERKLRG